MEGDSEQVAAAFRGCRSAAGTDLAPAVAWSSSIPIVRGARDARSRSRLQRWQADASDEALARSRREHELLCTYVGLQWAGYSG
jgi:hypothetical protein